MSKQSKNRRIVRYHLRVFMPSRDWQSDEEALWRIIRLGQIDEVVFLVPHVEQSSPGLGTPAECERQIEVLAPLFERLRAQSITPSINIWWTMGFSNFSGQKRDLRSKFNFRWAVSQEGVMSTAIACPADENWRKEVKRVYQTFARLRPIRIWLDDDFRAILRADLHSPCFCDWCLAEMARRTGTARSRHELCAAILADPPNPVRVTWLKFQAELIADVARMLAETVHSISPETHVSVMFSPIEGHFAEGRCWADHLNTLGKPTPYVRPPFGAYTERGPWLNAEGLNEGRLSFAVIKGDVVFAPEIETYPYSRFATSARLVRLRLMLGPLVGYSEITLSIFSAVGPKLSHLREEIWERMLGEVKPCLQAIADLNIAKDQNRGVALYFHEDIAQHVRGVAHAAKVQALIRQRPLDTALPMMGIATCYGSGPITVLSGEQPLCASEVELERIFSGGVLLDARAAESLLWRGMGKWAGVRRRVTDGMGTGAFETIEDSRFGHVGERMTIRLEGIPWCFEFESSAKEISCLRTYSGERGGHGVILYENELGGRVAILPFDSQSEGSMTSETFVCWTRQTQLKAVLEWLGQGPLPLFVPRAPCAYPMLVHQAERLIVSVANYCSDPIQDLTIQVAPPPFPIRKVFALVADGSWYQPKTQMARLDNGAVEVVTNLSLDHLDVAVLRME